VRFRSIALASLLVFACARGSGLPELYPVPSSSLVAHTGAPVKTDDLKGSVAVYDFIFTSCPGPCPLMTREMKRLKTDLRNVRDIRFVSITVDPVKDTPAVLAQYARIHGAGEGWLFLTGDRQEIIELSIDGFKLGVGPVDPGSTQPIFHSTKFVLVDRSGMIRGYYESTSKDEMEKLRKDARALARES
jgi:protein SCO1